MTAATTWWVLSSWPIDTISTLHYLHYNIYTIYTLSTQVGALIMAGNFSIPEVTVYFNHKLLRGNRTVKVTLLELETNL